MRGVIKFACFALCYLYCITIICNKCNTIQPNRAFVVTRMWMVNPDVLCRQHLLGEHKELHQLVGMINAERLGPVRGHARLSQIDTTLIKERHEALVAEMIARGYNHKSPLPDFVDPLIGVDCIDIDANYRDLFDRCFECQWRGARLCL